MSPGRFDPLRVFRSLDRHGVRFIVIGGVAGRLHGSPTVTNDTDVCYERSPENLGRLAAALAELGAELRGVDGQVPFIPDAKTLAAGDHFTFTSRAGDLDILGTPAGVGGFGDLVERAEEFDVDGLTVLAASVDDLIRMKRAAGRPKDLIELEVLGAVRDEIESEGHEQGRAG